MRPAAELRLARSQNRQRSAGQPNAIKFHECRHQKVSRKGRRARRTRLSNQVRSRRQSRPVNRRRPLSRRSTAAPCRASCGTCRSRKKRRCRRNTRPQSPSRRKPANRSRKAQSRTGFVETRWTQTSSEVANQQNNTRKGVDRRSLARSAAPARRRCSPSVGAPIVGAPAVGAPNASRRRRSSVGPKRAPSAAG